MTAQTARPAAFLAQFRLGADKPWVTVVPALPQATARAAAFQLDGHMQRAGFYYSELADHREDLAAGHVLTADNHTEFRVVAMEDADEDSKPRGCYHPRSCRACDRQGKACGQHTCCVLKRATTGTTEHDPAKRQFCCRCVCSMIPAVTIEVVDGLQARRWHFCDEDRQGAEEVLGLIDLKFPSEVISVRVWRDGQEA